MKIFKVILLLLSGLCFLYPFEAIYSQGNNIYKPVEEFDPGRDPGKDLQEAIAEAERTNRRIILDVGGDWCIWCHRMDEFINNNKDIKNFMKKNFIVLKVNFSRENKNEKFFSKYPEIPGYPHLFVLDSDGGFLHSQDTGELEEDKGYGTEKFLDFLRKWSPGKS